MSKIGSIHDFLRDMLSCPRHDIPWPCVIAQAVSLPAGPGDSPGGDPEGKAAGSSENPAFYSAK